MNEIDFPDYLLRFFVPMTEWYISWVFLSDRAHEYNKTTQQWCAHNMILLAESPGNITGQMW